ncbi:MobH family relaxase [Motilimonas cestriensis]|uniref:MobH family relaxase n=1 Tax=Motilimonas cestriensis TaxID=2742685 RepID=UPI003DA30857
MLKWLTRNTNKDSKHKSAQTKRRGRFENEVVSGQELLRDPARMQYIKEIKTSISISSVHWEQLYLSLIQNFARYVQNLPASEGYHHSYAGGLLDHSLEVMQYAVRARRGVLYPRGGKEDLISKKADIFSYAVASASLLHDVGKVIADLLVAHTDKESKDQNIPTIWTPTIGFLPIGERYVWKANEHKINKLHEVAGLQVLSLIMPSDGIKWLFSDQELYHLWLQVISGQYGQSGLLGELIQNADHESVQSNIGKVVPIAQNLNRYQQTKSNTVSLFTTKLMQVLKDELQKGELRMNVAGAAGWVKDNRIYLVSKRVAEMLRNRMLADESVSSSTPKNPISIINMLNEANLLIRNADGESIYHFNIVDRQFKKGEVWQQTLSFIVIEQELLDPNKTLNNFEGEITEVSRIEPIAVEEAEPKVETKAQTQKKKLTDGLVKFASEPQNVTKNIKGKGGVASASIRWDVEIHNWIKLMIRHNQITFNQPNSQIHVVDRKVCLVTPNIFIVFANENTQLIESISDFDGLSKSQITKSIERGYLTKMKGKLLTGFIDENMLSVTVKGARKSSKMVVIALRDGNIIFDEIPHNNNVLSWDCAPMI